MVQAAVAVAERLYGSAEDAPDAVGWLLDEEFAFGEPYGTADEFLGDLADAVAHQGTCTDTTVEAIPFLLELVRDGGLAPGSRLILLCDLMRLGASGPAAAVALADRLTALGGVQDESAADHLTLMTALLSDDRKGLIPALDRLASWLPGVAEKAAGPNVDREQLALAVLPGLVREEVWPGPTPERDLP
ncbi:hypothetical protein [Streptomyces cyaneofuscatus]|uniref:hypothetical protein n=1 Tax=Streptomyces cyaneofuscatus TaxID=66883 RepID=UPI00381289DE